MKQRGKLRWILMAICLVCLVVSGIWLGRYWLQSRRTMENVAELKKLVQEAEAQAPEEEGSGLLRLAEENSDLAGWIRVPGTAVDYPVMLPPADAPEYYLRRNFQREYDINGIPFLDARCTVDPCSDNLIIYGHNMYSGVMFHDLLSYRKEDFWREHPVVEFETLTDTGRYEVIGAFLYDASSGADAFKPHASVDFADEETFDAYMEEVRSAAYYDTGVQPVYGRQILALVTCDRSVLSNGRLVIVTQEMPEDGV